jgi:phage terminase large subunit GpA-like protein
MTPTPIQSIFHDAISAAIPDTNLTAADWADTYRTVSQGPDTGSKWRTDRVPGLREMLIAGSHVRVKEIVIGGCSRWGKTEGVLNNYIGRSMHIEPMPIMMVQPKKEAGEKYSRDRLDSLIRETPVLRSLVEDPRVRDSGNTRMHKVFPGGHITIASANVPADLAAEDICLLLLDEIDRFPRSAGGGEDAEGDPIALARKRTTQYQQTGEALVIMTSSPTIEGRSRIAQAYGKSDQCEFWCQCPGCDEWQKPEWKNVKWSEIDLPASQAKYMCPHCAVILDEDERLDMLYRYRWISQAAVAAGVGHLDLWDWYSHPAFNGVAGFWFPGLASTFVSMAQMAEELTEAARENSLLAKQVWVNTTLGELWKPWEEIDKDDLEFRTEEYKAEVPAGAVLLTFFIDVQLDRVECEVAGWGVDDERWSIDYKVFRGDPSRVEVQGETTVWDEVWDYFEREWKHELGVKVKVRCGGIDTGGNCTDAVYEFCKKAAAPKLWRWREGRMRRLYWATKGASVPGRPIAPKKPSRVGRLNVALYTIGTETAKDRVFAALKIGWGPEGRWVGGPGSYHFPASNPYDDDYFAQVRSERAIQTFHRGYPVRRWIPIREGIRNEAWDCLVGNLAAKEILKPNLKSYQKVLLESVEALKRAGAAAPKNEPDEPDDDGRDGHGGEPEPSPATRQPSSPSSFRVPRRPGGYNPRRW